MKTLTCILFLLFLTTTAVHAQSDSLTDQAYQDMASKICTCVNANSKTVPVKLKAVIADAVNDGTDLGQAFVKYVEDNPKTGSNDLETLVKLSDAVTLCTEKLTEIYENAGSEDMQEMIVQKLVEKMVLEKGCSFAYSLVFLGMQEEK